MSFSPAVPNSMGVVAPEHAAPGAVSGDLTAPGAGAEADVYQVIFAPDDIRELTLEQLDDCYRLGLIDETTWVWAAGMENWETLAEAAGLGAAEPDPDSAVRPRPGAQLGTPPPLPGELPPPLPPVSAAPGAMTGAAMSAYPSGGAYHQIASNPVAIGQSAPAWTPPPFDATWPSAPAVERGPSSWPAPASYPAAYAAAAPPPSSHPLSMSNSGPFPGVVEAAPAPSIAPFAPQTAPPLVFDTHEDNPFQARSGGLRGRFQATLLVVGLLVGGTVTAYRNDLILEAARSANLEATYLRFERQWFGGAPAGTPRQVEGLLGPRDAQPTALGASAVVGSLQPASEVSDSSGEAREPNSPAASAVKEAPEPAKRLSGALSAEEESSGAEPPRGVEPEPAPAAPAKRSAARVTSPKPVPKPAPRAQRAVAAKPKPAPSPVRKPAAPAKAAKPAPAPKPVNAKPTPAPGTDEFLRMSIRQAVKSGSKAKKKAPSASAYDPLNGDI